MTGCRSIPALVAWKTGTSVRNAHTVAAVAARAAEFPQCVEGLRAGRLSLDQVGVIAGGAADGSDAHYAELAAVATVSQLRTAVKLEPRPQDLTELSNLVLVCPFHHRLHHRGEITLSGPAEQLIVTDSDGDRLYGGSLARPPTSPPPQVPPYRGPTGERADWWWYEPFQPQPPPSNN